MVYGLVIVVQGEALLMLPEHLARLDDRRQGVMGDWGDPIIQVLQSSSCSRRTASLAACLNLSHVLDRPLR
jgi:hypothetical protein